MGKLIIDLSELNKIDATLTHPVQLRLIIQIKCFDQLTGILTVTNILKSQLSNNKIFSQPSFLNKTNSSYDDNNPNNRSEPGYPSAVETLQDQSQTSSLSDSTTGISHLDIDLKYILRHLSYHKMNILKDGYLMDIEVFFRGFEEEIVAIGLNEIREPELIIEELKSLIEFQNTYPLC